jgi:hypothetical protein
MFLQKPCSVSTPVNGFQNVETQMELNIEKEIAALQRMTIDQLRNRFWDVFGEQTHARNKEWLVRRIAWRIQAQVEGDLSERARQRASELANDADLRVSAPKAVVPAAAPERTMTAKVALTADNRLPLPGTIITRPYKGQMLQVKVLREGFEFEGEVFNSLSAAAKRITGSHCNGYLFFRLSAERSAK